MTPARVTVVLGPTNTGKTHYAIERMIAYRSGMIGLPLRLLAREVYDRIVGLRGPSVVALVTGEERIIPARAQYWVCTTEAMPEGMAVDFLAVDEIQLCADPERGHVFTDRLLHARGVHETLFLGSDTMRGAIAALVPGAQFQGRERFSTLTYTGSKKISRLPARSAIVGFSVENVYAIAEYIRRTRGGAAVVMGALSPRTRNAQVALYQAGEVDYLVATDAIGMGLNLDITHVAFSALRKFDGHRMRALAADELAQIAGRAGRHQAHGTFGVTGEATEIDAETVARIENHQFRPVTRLMWRNSDLEFGSLPRLIRALEKRTDDPWLGRVRESDDLAALRALAGDSETAARATGPRAVRLLWDVCRVPDFRGLSREEHAQLLAVIYGHLHERGHLPRAWFAEHVHRLDRCDGDIDTLSRRLAFIRTWTYVAQRNGWVEDESHWREETRAVEDRLSDALHGALTQAFVDRRTSVLARRLRQKEVLVAEVNDTGEVTVEGQFVGRIEGFRFRMDESDNADEARTLRTAATQALAPHFHLRADRFYNAPDTEIDFTEQGGLMWGELAVGRLQKGPTSLRPQAVAFVDEEAGEEVAAKVQRRLQHFIDRRVANVMEPLLALEREEGLSGLARGMAFRLVERLGIIPRGEIAAEVKALDQEARASLRKLGVRFGQYTVFVPALLKPAPTRLRLVLWGLDEGMDEIPPGPPPGHVTIPALQGMPPGFHAMAGYRAVGERAVRIDMLERLADMLRARDSKAGFEAVPEMLSITGLSLELFAGVLQGLGYRAERGERPKQAVAKVAKGEGAAAEATTPEAETEAQPEAKAVAEAGTRVEGEARVEAEAPADAGTPTEAAAAAEAEAGAGAPSEVQAEAEAPAGAVAGTEAGAPAEAVAGTEAGAPAESGGVEADLPDAVAGRVETEVFYTFTWVPRGARRPGRGPRRDDGDGAARPPRGKARNKHADDAAPAAGGAGGDAARPKRGKPVRRAPREDRNAPKVFEAHPPREEAAHKNPGRRDHRRVDPDSPFAALAELMKRK